MSLIGRRAFKEKEPYKIKMFESMDVFKTVHDWKFVDKDRYWEGMCASYFKMLC